MVRLRVSCSLMSFAIVCPFDVVLGAAQVAAVVGVLRGFGQKVASWHMSVIERPPSSREVLKLLGKHI